MRIFTPHIGLVRQTPDGSRTSNSEIAILHVADGNICLSYSYQSMAANLPA